MYRFVALAQRGKHESLGISQAHEAVIGGKWRVLITAAVRVTVVRTGGKGFVPSCRAAITLGGV